MVRTRPPIGGRVVTPPPPPVVPAAPVLPPGAVVPPGRVIPPAPVFPAVVPARGAPPRPEPALDVAVVPPKAPVSPPEPAPPGAPAPPASVPPGGTGVVLPAVVTPPSLVVPPLMVVPPAAVPPAWVPAIVPDELSLPLQPNANGVPSSSTRTKGRAFRIIFMTSPGNDDVSVSRSVLFLSCDMAQADSGELPETVYIRWIRPEVMCGFYSSTMTTDVDACHGAEAGWPRRAPASRFKGRRRGGRRAKRNLPGFPWRRDDGRTPISQDCPWFHPWRLAPLQAGHRHGHRTAGGSAIGRTGTG
jgi:hypothetical protein